MLLLIAPKVWKYAFKMCFARTDCLILGGLNLQLSAQHRNKIKKKSKFGR